MYISEAFKGTELKAEYIEQLKISAFKRLKIQETGLKKKEFDNLDDCLVLQIILLCSVRNKKSSRKIFILKYMK